MILADAIGQVGEADTALERGDPEAARRLGHAVIGRLRAVKPTRGVQEVQKYVTLFWAADIAGQAEYRLGNYAAAEAAEREAVDARKRYLTEAIGDRRDIAVKSTWLAMSLAKQGRLKRPRR